MRATLSVVEGPLRLEPLPDGGFEHVTDERLEAELQKAGLLVTGSGGGGHGDPGGSGGGGGDDGDGEEEWGPRHYSGAMRAVAVVTVSFLILGTAGAWISIAIGGVQQTFPSQVAIVSATQPRATHPGGRALPASWKVDLQVTNHSGNRGAATCEVVVDDGGHEGWAVVPAGPIGRNATVTKLVTVKQQGPSSGPGVRQRLAMAACGPSLTR